MHLLLGRKEIRAVIIVVPAGENDELQPLETEGRTKKGGSIVT